MKKVLVMVTLLSVTAFGELNQNPIKPIKPTAMEQSIEKTENTEITINSAKKSNVNFLVESFESEITKRSITSHWKAEMLLGGMFLMLALMFVGRTKRKRAISL